MTERVAPGLTADWVNGWLAAVGVTVLVPGVRLGWTDHPVPRARFDVPEGEDLAGLVAKALPTVEELGALSITGLPQNMTREQYVRAAAAARRTRDPSLAVLATDVGGGGHGEPVPTGPFNVGAPRGETLHRRLLSCRSELESVAELPAAVDASFDGRGMRVKVNGLAFDYRRIVEETSKRVDPVVECLCFFGLWLFPMGGTGRLARQRGWVGPPYRRHAFLWPAWSPALNRWAIDALLDLVHRAVSAEPLDSGRKLSPALRRAGVTALYGSVPYRSLGSNDTTRGYAGERVA